MTPGGIKTPFGVLAGYLEPTYHVNWLTYARDRQAKQVGLQDIFTDFYGKKMEMLEVTNDSHFCWNIKPEELDEYTANKLKQCVNEGRFEYWYLNSFLTDLVNKDILPEGEYVVTVSW